MSDSNQRPFKYLFGPVPSRRLGMSLGVDLVPFKTCTLDCVYCESGKTTLLTMERKNYIPPDKIIQELSVYLSKSPMLDFITFSGHGEPLLNSGISKIVAFLKKNYPQYRIALLTNSTLFFSEEVRHDVLDIDLIIASLDAVSGSVVGEINRPHKKLHINDMIQGLVALRREYKNELWLEIFIVPGLNDSESELRGIDRVIKKIGADKIQLNSLDRPGTENWVAPLDKFSLAEISKFFNTSEIINKVKSQMNNCDGSKNIYDEIINLISRRPCTVEDLVESLGVGSNEVEQHVGDLIEQKKIICTKMNRGDFFKIREN